MAGIPVAHGIICHMTNERNAIIIRRFKGGAHIEQLSKDAALTVQSIRHILKDAGLSAYDGGKKMEIILRRSAAEEEKKFKMKPLYGCTAFVLKMFRPDVRGRFTSQKMSAIRRGIEFNMTLPEWWAVWERSGKYDERGRSGYVMARNGDVGPYELGNVHICTSSENLKEGFVNKPVWKRKKPDRLTNRKPGAQGWSYDRTAAEGKRFSVRLDGKRYGAYATADEARAQYLVEFSRRYG